MSFILVYSSVLRHVEGCVSKRWPVWSRVRLPGVRALCPGHWYSPGYFINIHSIYLRYPDTVAWACMRMTVQYLKQSVLVIFTSHELRLYADVPNGCQSHNVLPIHYVWHDERLNSLADVTTDKTVTCHRYTPKKHQLHLLVVWYALLAGLSPEQKDSTKK